MKPGRLGAFATLGIDIVYFIVLAFVACGMVTFIVQNSDAAQFEQGVRTVFGQFDDYRSYFSFGKLAASEEHAHLYEYSVQERWFCSVSTPPGVSCKDFPYIPYQPFFALLIKPFTFLPISTGYGLWCLTGMVAFFAALLPWTNRQRPLMWLASLGLAVASLATLPVLRCIVLGQSSLLVGALIALFFWSWACGRERLAGVLMALSAFKPQFIIFSLIPAVAQKRWNMLITFVITELALWCLCVPFIGIEPLFGMVPGILRVATTSWDQLYTMLSLRALFAWLPPGVERVLALAILLAGMAFLYRLWQKAPPFGLNERSRWLVALTILVCLTTSNYSQLYDAVLVAIPAACTLSPIGAGALLQERGLKRLWWLLLYLYPIGGWLAYVVLGARSHWFYHWFTFWDVLLAVVCYLRLRSVDAETEVFKNI